MKKMFVLVLMIIAFYSSPLILNKATYVQGITPPATECYINGNSGARGYFCDFSACGGGGRCSANQRYVTIRAGFSACCASYNDGCETFQNCTPSPIPTDRPPRATATSAVPTVTPGGPTLTPTPTANSCKCNSNNVCKNTCTFDKFADINTYKNSITCKPANSSFKTTPTAGDRDAFCQATKKTKGDADLNGTVSIMDYFYFVMAKAGIKMPHNINTDFNGDGKINADDRVIIIKSLKQ